MSMVSSRHALFITGSDVARLLPMSDAIGCVQELFEARGQGRASDQPRCRLHVPESSNAAPDAPRAMMHVLGGTLSAHGVLGTKTYVTTRQGGQFVVLLFSVDGPLLAVIEARVLGQIRTGAASGVATRFLARPDAQRLAVIGSGFQARGQVEAMCLVRPIREVRVYSRKPENAQRFCQSMRCAVDAELVVASTAEEAVEGADIVVTATTSRDPVLRGTWLRPGMHVNAMGSNAVNRRELDEDAVRRATLVVVDDMDQARNEAGDLIAVVKEGHLTWDAVVSLEDVVSGPSGRQSDDQITLFESQGLASEDVAVARYVHEAARRAGIGTPLPLSES